MISVFLFVAELIASAILLFHHIWEKRRNVLLYIRPRTLKLPVVDAKIRSMAGKPSRTERYAARTITAMIRKAVHTEAFGHFVQAQVNRRSPLVMRSRLKPQITLCV